MLSTEGKMRLLHWRGACFALVSEVEKAEREIPRQTPEAFRIDRSFYANAFFAIGLVFDLGYAITLPDCLTLADAVLDNKRDNG